MVDFPTNEPADDEEDEELEEEDDEPSAPAATPAEAAARIVVPKPKKPKARRGAAPSGLGNPRAAGPGRLPNPAGWPNKEADFMWTDMCRELKALGKTPWDITMLCVRMDPPPVQTLNGQINGGACSGSESETPGQMLVRMVDDNFHMPISRTPATYDIVFMWKQDGTIWGRGRLARPGPQDIQAMRQAQYQHQQIPPPAPGYGGPQQQPSHGGGPQQHPYGGGGGYPQQHPAPYGYPQQHGAQHMGPGYVGMGYPQQQQQQGSYDPEVVNLRMQVGQLTGQLTQVLAYIERQGVAVPAGLAAPPPPAPPQIVYQQAPQQQQTTGLGAELSSLDAALSGLERLRGLSDRLNSTFGRTVVTGVGSPDDGDADPDDSPSAAPKDDGLPFAVIPIPETSLKYAKNKETGNIDWMGIGIANADSEVVKKVVGLAGDFIQGIVKAAGVKGGDAIPGGYPGRVGMGQPAALPQQNGVVYPQQNGHANGAPAVPPTPEPGWTP